MMKRERGVEERERERCRGERGVEKRERGVEERERQRVLTLGGS